LGTLLFERSIWEIREVGEAQLEKDSMEKKPKKLK